LIWGLRPQTPCTLACGDPKAPRRSRGSLALLVRFCRDLSPDPLHARLRGPQSPAPLAWLTRFARSLLPGLVPRPLARSLAGTPTPSAARVAHSLCSFASAGTSSPDPLHARLRGPSAPRRSRGSLALLARFCRDLSPDPLHARLRGPSASADDARQPAVQL